MNVLIIGGGFIGLGIGNILNEDNDIANVFIKTRHNELPDSEIDLIIDATAQKSHRECKTFCSQLEMICQRYPNAKCIVLQSFSTLQDTALDSTQFNFGSKVFFHTPYSKIKLYKEELLTSSEMLSGRLSYFYLPIVIGDNGIWSHLSDELNRSGKKVCIPNIQSHWTGIRYLVNQIKLNWMICNQRLAVVEGREYLDVLLKLENFKRLSYRYSVKVDAFLFTLFSVFRKAPFIINACMVIFEKLVYRRKVKFPTTFYWLLFVRQNDIF